MKVLGVFGGIGSMMIGAKKQGYQVIGNIEDRKYFFTGTFEYNFPGAFFVHSIDELTEEQRAECMNVDLIMGHPKCGSFSNMRQHTASLDESRKELAGNFGRFIGTNGKNDLQNMISFLSISQMVIMEMHKSANVCL